MAQPNKVPSNIAVPSVAPTDILSLVGLLTTFFAQIANWIAAAANRMNSNDKWLNSETAPATPPVGQFVIYMDSADNKLKCKGPSGTITVLGLP